MDSDVLKTLSGGFGLASRLMGRGVDEVAKAVRKGEEPPDGLDTGLYFTPWEASDSWPRVRFLESQEKNRLNVNLLKNLTMSSGEKDFLAGVAALQAGHPAEAMGKLREATRRGDPKVQLTDAYFLLGAVLVCQGGGREAQAEATRVLKTALLAQASLGKSLRRFFPSFHVALPLTRHSCFCLYPDLLGLNLLLSLAQRSEEPAEAVASLEQFLEIVPQQPLALFFVNLLRLRLGAHREVFEALARTLPDSNVQVANTILLGKACYRLGDPTTAREIFRKALQRQDLDPTLKLDLRWALSEALRAEGYTSDADHEARTVRAEDSGYRPLEERLGVPQAAPKAPVPAPEPEVAEESPPPEPPPPAPLESFPPLSAEGGTVTRLTSADGEIDFELKGATVVIGREEGDIQVDDASASKLHAEVSFDEGLYWIEDKGSTNGTWVNRHRIRRRVELHRGDVIQIGETRLQVR